MYRQKNSMCTFMTIVVMIMREGFFFCVGILLITSHSYDFTIDRVAAVEFSEPTHIFVVYENA